MTDSDNPTLICPTCGARQSLSAECRRCRCDLTLLLAVRRRQNELHQTVLRQLRDRRHAAALAAARRLWALAADETSARLLAVCYLRNDRFQAALDVRDAMAAERR